MNTADQQILLGSPATITALFTDQNGVAADAAGTVTVGVTADDGTVILAPGTATTKTAEGVYDAALPSSATAWVDELTATWTDGTQTVITHVEVVGGYYVALGDLRGELNLGNSQKFPTDRLIRARRWFEATTEDFIRVAFVPRYRKVTVWGGGQDSIQVPNRFIRTLRKIQFGTVNLAPSALQNTVATADGKIQRYWPYLTNGTDDSWGAWGQIFPNRTRITVAYEHGLDGPPSDLQEAAKIAIRLHLLLDITGRPTVSVADGAGGSTRFALPGPNRPTGIPDVDEVLLRLKERYAVDQATSLHIA